jgi:hypothetical protein
MLVRTVQFGIIYYVIHRIGFILDLNVSEKDLAYEILFSKNQIP